MGEVYLAEDPRLGRRVALKLLRIEANEDSDRLRRFAREARAASALSHPNVCMVHEVGDTAAGRPFLAMEYVEGTSLRARLEAARATGTRIPLGDAVAIASQAAAGLAAAHAAGIIHRDVKPENLLVRPDGLVKVVDFGLAAWTGAPEAQRVGESRDGSVHTAAGVVLGTVPYMSPEQLRGLALDARTDVWSLGTVLYELLAGQPAFAGSTQSDLVVAVLEREPAPLADLEPDVPVALHAALQATVSRTLRKDRDERHSCMSDLAQELQAIRDAWHHADAASRPITRPVPAGPAPSRLRVRDHLMRGLPGPHGRRRLVAVALGTAAMAVAGAVTLRPVPAVGDRGDGSDARLDSKRVLVTAFENRTGDPHLDALGAMAADWISVGLQSVEAVRVVDPGTAFLTAHATASDTARGSAGGRAEPSASSAADAAARALARSTGAGTVVWGALMQTADSLSFVVKVTDVGSGERRATVEVGGPTGERNRILAELRQRVGGAVARTVDERVGVLAAASTPPPTLDAYRAYVAGLELFAEHKYRAAAPLFLRAAALDTTFLLPRFWAMFALGNGGNGAARDSIVDATVALRDRMAPLTMTPLDAASIDFFAASKRGNPVEVLRAIQRVAALAPGSNWTYMEGFHQRRWRRPRAALRALDQIDPTRGWARGWSTYWYERAMALHALGAFEREVSEMRRARPLTSGNVIVLAAEARGLAAAGREGDVRALVDSVLLQPASPAAGTNLGNLPSVWVAWYAGIELVAHGHTRAGEEMLGRVLAWYDEREGRWESSEANQAGMLSNTYWGTLYALGRLEELEREIRAVLRERPGMRDADAMRYLGFITAQTGRRAEAERVAAWFDAQAERDPRWRSNALMIRGVLAGLLGDKEPSVRLLREAFAQGHPEGHQLHIHPALLAAMRGYAPFEALLTQDG
jgi:hypothetical protein